MRKLKLFSFYKIADVKVIPVSLKIVVILALFIVLSNLTTNYISLGFNRVNQTHNAKQLLVNDLKELLNFMNIQWQIQKINGSGKQAIANIQKKGRFELTKPSSVFIGINKQSEVTFNTLQLANSAIDFDLQPIRISEPRNESFIVTTINGVEYFGVYKFNRAWDMYVFRGEQADAFYAKTWENFVSVVAIIILITILLVVLATYAVRYILRFIELITSELIDMSKQQQLKKIDMKGAANDDVTYLGMAFNALSSDIDNLIRIFKKFTDRDIVQRAYQEKKITLDGEQKDLTMLFTDIKGYTFMTETLGADVIKLLNIQYDHSIDHIYEHDGIIASIIGDALLAVYGVMPLEEGNRSYAALQSAFKIIDATSQLKETMEVKREHYIQEHGEIPEEHEKIFQAMLLDVGIGLDCGTVFYGTIGSDLRMTTTVIGDSVNAAARIEGLTRVYGVPILCSGNIRDDIVEHGCGSEFTFVEVDCVQVKGKTQQTTLYWPLRNADVTPELTRKLALYAQALKEYRFGRWAEARPLFKAAGLPLADALIERTQGDCPSGWNGIWVLNDK